MESSPVSEQDETTTTSASSPDTLLRQPWLWVWVRPRDTLRAILDTNPEYLVAPLAMLAGVLRTINVASSRSVGDALPLIVILVFALVIGPFAGLIGIYLSAVVLRWAGSLFGGQGDTADLRAALAWGQIPALATVFLLIPEILFFGESLFTSDSLQVEPNAFMAALLLTAGLLQIFLGLWSVITIVACVAEAHRFSSWRAIATLILGGLILLLPLYVLLFACSGLTISP